MTCCLDLESHITNRPRIQKLLEILKKYFKIKRLTQTCTSMM